MDKYLAAGIAVFCLMWLVAFVLIGSIDWHQEARDLGALVGEFKKGMNEGSK